MILCTYEIILYITFCNLFHSIKYLVIILYCRNIKYFVYLHNNSFCTNICLTSFLFVGIWTILKKTNLLILFLFLDFEISYNLNILNKRFQAYMKV